MRDPDRIDEILNLVKENWMKDTDMRFMQLLYVLQSGISKEEGDTWKVQEKVVHGHSRVGYDMFNYEDDELLSFLKKRLDNYPDTGEGR